MCSLMLFLFGSLYCCCCCCYYCRFMHASAQAQRRLRLRLRQRRFSSISFCCRFFSCVFLLLLLFFFNLLCSCCCCSYASCCCLLIPRMKQQITRSAPPPWQRWRVKVSSLSSFVFRNAPLILRLFSSLLSNSALCIYVSLQQQLCTCTHTRTPSVGNFR